jgi:hypothetical protein
MLDSLEHLLATEGQVVGTVTGGGKEDRPIRTDLKDEGEK